MNWPSSNPSSVTGLRPGSQVSDNNNYTHTAKNRTLALNIYETINDEFTESNSRSEALLSTMTSSRPKRMSWSMGNLDEEARRPLLSSDTSQQRQTSASEGQLANIIEHPESLSGRRTRSEYILDSEEEKEDEDENRKDETAMIDGKFKQPTVRQQNLSETMNFYNDQKDTVKNINEESLQIGALEQTIEDDGIYARPKLTLPRGSNFVDTEISQSIEWKKRRMLMLLQSREAPKASFELTSPITDQEPIIHDDQSLAVGEGRRNISPACVSYYDNVNQSNSSSLIDKLHKVALEQNNIINDYEKENESEERLDREAMTTNRTKVEKINTNDSDNDEGGHNTVTDEIGPSGGDEANTLSLVSDILGDLSQEGNSLVQQLSRDQSVNQFS